MLQLHQDQGLCLRLSATATPRNLSISVEATATPRPKGVFYIVCYGYIWELYLFLVRMLQLHQDQGLFFRLFATATPRNLSISVEATATPRPKGVFYIVCYGYIWELYLFLVRMLQLHQDQGLFFRLFATATPRNLSISVEATATP